MTETALPDLNDKAFMFDMILRVLILVLALISAVIFAWDTPGLPVDDAYIHLTFARNIGDGNGISFNPGEFSLGFSSPLWILLLSVIHFIGGDILIFSRYLGIIFYALCAVLLFDIVKVSIAHYIKSLRVSRILGFLAGLLLVVSGNMVWIANSGMESMLFLLIGLSAIVLITSGRKAPLPLGILLGLLLLTRSTGIALFAILLVVSYFHWGRLQTVKTLIISAFVCGPWYLFSFFKTGDLVPSTRAGKIASTIFSSGFNVSQMNEYFLLHLKYMWLYNRGFMIMALLSLVGLVAVTIFRFLSKDSKESISEHKIPAGFLKFSPASILFYWALSHFCMHLFLFRSAPILTPYHCLRYQVMLIPAIICLFIFLLAGLSSLLDKKYPSLKGMTVFTIVIICLGIFVIEFLNFPPWQKIYFRQVDQLQKEHLVGAKWASLQLPKDARIACIDVGILGYYSRRYIIDLGGLIDPKIIPDLAKKRTGPFMVKKGVTHYFDMVRHPSDTITGVKSDHGKLYSFSPLNDIQYPPPYTPPLTFHSLGIHIYQVNILK